MPDRSTTSHRRRFPARFDDQRSWGATGYLLDDLGVLRSYRCGLTSSPGGDCSLRLDLADVASGEHRHQEERTAGPLPAPRTGERRRFGRFARIEETPEGLRLQVRADRFRLDLQLGHGKTAHTNLPTSGRVTVDGRSFAVAGKSWLGGPPGRAENRFSMRFFDDEEMDLVTSDEAEARDGVYVTHDGQALPLTHYALVALGETLVGERVYPQGWRLHVPWLKAERYSIRPLGEGHVRQGRRELLAGVHDPTQRMVGYCVAELLPGVRNELPSVQRFHPTAP